MSVLIETSLGDIVIDLFTEERPRCSLNFLKLCKLKMYNYCLVHNVQRNFMIQTGNIDNSGGSSIYRVVYGEQAKLFEKEPLPKMKHTDKLTVSMVNDGNGYHGSQFLITTRDDADTLDGVHTVFGRVAEGEDVIDLIDNAYVDDTGRPYQDIRIHHTVVLHDPFPDPGGALPVPPRSPSPPPHVLESDRLAVGEVVNKLDGHSTEQVLEYMEEKELKANTQMLEIIGDIPDADVKPPEDVLFVCKLNPVTSSDDLEIIFSRFGPIQSCEVIRDWKTQESLCYAFIEFEEVADCEAAYFKMDNVLIDERRIHVDFSQSVSKLYWNRNSKNRERYTEQKNVQREDKRDEQAAKPHNVRVQENQARRNEHRDRRNEHRDRRNEHRDRQNEHRDRRNEHRDRRNEHRDRRNEHGDRRNEHGDRRNRESERTRDASPETRKREDYRDKRKGLREERDHCSPDAKKPDENRRQEKKDKHEKESKKKAKDLQSEIQSLENKIKKKRRNKSSGESDSVQESRSPDHDSRRKSSKKSKKHKHSRVSKS